MWPCAPSRALLNVSAAAPPKNSCLAWWTTRCSIASNWNASPEELPRTRPKPRAKAPAKISRNKDDAYDSRTNHRCIRDVAPAGKCCPTDSGPGGRRRPSPCILSGKGHLRPPAHLDRGSVRRLVASLSVMAPAIHTGSAAGLAADCRPVSLIWYRDHKLR